MTEKGLRRVAPLEAILLGVAGLLPLFIAAAIAFAVPRALGFSITRGAIFYAATTLSFLGGMHWGLACGALSRDHAEPHARQVLCYSVVPSLVGFFALFLPDQAAALVLAFAYLAVLLIDRHIDCLGYGPSWWMHLRGWLTAVAAPLLLLLAATAARH